MADPQVNRHDGRYYLYAASVMYSGVTGAHCG